jgi:S-adenosylmethionine synthetase
MMKFQVSEWVSLGHPDKIADYISSYILDRHIERDQYTRYALEVQIKDHFVTLGGEITSAAQFSDEEIARFVRQAVAEIGYTKEYQQAWGRENAICADDIEVTAHIGRQSPDIAQGVGKGGWGDQGIMFGMAINCPETNYMPMDIFAARKIGRKLYDDRVGGLDIKTQVYVSSKGLEKVVAAIPMLEQERDGATEKVRQVILDCFPWFTGEVVVNGTGRYVKHSSMGDCGTTGRKLAVDFYGGNCMIGGGSPWTKDGTKADLSLNLLARRKAVEYVKLTGTREARCAIACCIGDPTISVSIYDQASRLEGHYSEYAATNDVINLFGLREPVFARMCREGLFYV